MGPVRPSTLLTIFLGTLFAGCFQQIAVNSLGGILDNGFEVLNEEQDLELADKSIASNLKLIETLLRTDPDNRHYLLLASMGYSSYALGFVEDESSDRARLFYLRGKEYGLKILNHNERFGGALEKGADELRRALESFSKDDVPAVFWTAIGWGSAIGLSLSDPAALADVQKVEVMMNFVLEKDPTYFYGGAHFFLGTLAATRPPMLGGSPENSRMHFEECLKINSGKYLMTYVYYARWYAVRVQNRELFERYLTMVDTASIDVLPEARLSNAIAKKKARLLRLKVDELF